MKRWLFGPQVDEPLAYGAYTGSVIELLANRLGSIITAISVSTGAVAAEYDYQAYGARTETATLDQPYGFTGREHDSESGLVHYRARAYDPVAGFFLQVDPIGFGGGTLGLYGYVSSDPLNWRDPSGNRREAGATQAQELFNVTGVGMSGVAIVGTAALSSAEQISKSLNDIVLFSRATGGDDSKPTNSSGGGNCGPGGDPESFFAKLRKHWFEIAAALFLFDAKPMEPGIQSSQSHVKVVESVRKTNEALKKRKDETDDDDKNCKK